MEKYKYLIVGGGIAGTTAAETIRKYDQDGKVAIISEEPYRLYSRIMLSKPNFFLGKIPVDKIFLKTNDWYKKNKINLLKGVVATKLDSKKKEVSADNGKKIQYEKLLIATGSCARKWSVAGSEKNGVFCLRDLDDTKRIMKAAKTAKRAVAIGGGFISFEISDLLRKSGVDVTVILRESYYWEPVMDEQAGKMIEKALEKNGVEILRNSEVQEVIGGDKVKGVVLKDGTKIDCDMIICGIGVTCFFDWLTNSKIKTNHGILANEYLETSLPDVWVAGDIAEYNDLIFGEVVQMANWANAQTQGMVAGANMADKKQAFKLISSYVTHGFGINISFVGNVRFAEDREIILRSSESYSAKILLKNGIIVGAIMINMAGELSSVKKLIERKTNVSKKKKQLSDTNFDLKLLMDENEKSKIAVEKIANQEKIRIGWFSFTCSSDSTILMTELLNEHWKDWKKNFDIRHARVLQSKNVLDELDIAFVEGAIASKVQEKELKEIRKKSKKLVAVGACAVVGMPSGQRNWFNIKQNKEIDFLLTRFAALKNVKKVSDVVAVDAEVPVCPMNEKIFLKAVNDLTKELKGGN